MDLTTNASSEKMMVRFPPGWRQAIKIAAARNGRSLNAEILFRLKDTVLLDLDAERRFEEAAAQK